MVVHLYSSAIRSRPRCGILSESEGKPSSQHTFHQLTGQSVNYGSTLDVCKVKLTRKSAGDVGKRGLLSLKKAQVILG